MECSRCGRALTDKESIARGVGPVCLRRETKKRRKAKVWRPPRRNKPHANELGGRQLELPFDD
jgi:hypothetical protein